MYNFSAVSLTLLFLTSIHRFSIMFSSGGWGPQQILQHALPEWLFFFFFFNRWSYVLFPQFVCPIGCNITPTYDWSIPMLNSWTAGGFFSPNSLSFVLQKHHCRLEKGSFLTSSVHRTRFQNSSVLTAIPADIFLGLPVLILAPLFPVKCHFFIQL